MPDPVITSLRKEICFAFYLKLGDRPLAGRIANPVLLGELLPGGTALVFGCYDLVLCHAGRNRRDGDAFYTEVFPRTFAVQIPLNVAVKQGEILVSVSRPFQVSLRPGRPTGVGFWEVLKGIFWDGTWLEILVNGEIAVEVLPAGESIPEVRPPGVPVAACDREMAANEEQKRKGMKDDSEEILGEEERKKTARKVGDEITIELEALADLVADLIRRRDEKTVEDAGTGPSPVIPEPEAVRQGKQSEQGNDRTHKQEAEMPGGITEERLEELVRKVILSLPLEQIPSRPGLYRSFTQNFPPPKPQGGGS